MKITTIGIDLAKSVFQVHAVDERGKKVFNRELSRAKFAEFMAKLPPCLIGMEACASAHHWARKLQGFGHTVKLMAPQFVKPYVKANKNDAADAEAICEAVTRPTMRFVPVKTVEQQALLSVHRSRQGFVQQRTALGNQMRGLLAEFGLVMPRGINVLRRSVIDLVDANEDELPANFRHLVRQLYQHIVELDRQIDELDGQIKAWHERSELSQRLAKIPGIGVLGASALVASIVDARAFENGRQLAAWLGLVPRQHSSGGKPRLLGISKRGDVYLRTLLIHGARSAIQAAHKASKVTPWLSELMKRRNYNVAAVALANKNARIIWALLAHDRDYQPDYVSMQAVA